MTEEMIREYQQREVDALTPDYDLVPPHLRAGLRDYIQRGQIPGDYLQAVMANDLLEAVNRGDTYSHGYLGVLMAWLYNDAPGGCWGSRGIIAAWSRLGGLEGGARPSTYPLVIAASAAGRQERPPLLTFVEAEAALNDQDTALVAAAMTEWHPSILAEMLKAVTEARYIRYGSSHPDWTAAVREVAEKARLEVS